MAAMVMVAISVFVAWPSGANACGASADAKAKRVVNPGGKAPLAIGDSTMLLSVPGLVRSGFQVNARGCRMWDEGMSVMRRYRRQGRLPHLIAIALGADYIITRGSIRQALHIAGPNRVLALMTPRELGGGTSNDADVVRRAYRHHTRRIVLLDWVRYTRNKGSWFASDGLHLNPDGVAGFTRLMRKSLRFARHGEFPKRSRFPR